MAIRMEGLENETAIKGDVKSSPKKRGVGSSATKPTTSPKKSKTLAKPQLVSQRRSRRLIEKDLIDPGSRSPGRRCEPHHREYYNVGRSLLKNGDSSVEPDDSLGSLGFYSADDLEKIIKESEFEINVSRAVIERESNEGMEGITDAEASEATQIENAILASGISVDVFSKTSRPSPRSPRKKAVVWSPQLEW